MIQEATIAIKITPNALTEIRQLMKKDNVQSDKSLRLGVKGGGCAGFSYIIDFDIATPDDNVYDFDGVKVIINRSQEIYLQGTELDFGSGLENRGFVFNNPNAESTCGCGTSFSA